MSSAYAAVLAARDTLVSEMGEAAVAALSAEMSLTLERKPIQATRVRGSDAPWNAMTTQIALLRGINVGGHKKVAMSDLRDFVAALGFADVRSLLQTGNIVFSGGAATGAGLERLLEVEAETQLDLKTAFFVRTARQLSNVIDRNAFAEAARRDPTHLVVLFLKDVPKPAAVKALRAAIDGPETVSADGKQLYAVYPAGIARSRLTNKLIEGKLGTRGTGRNWNTVLKLAALADA